MQYLQLSKSVVHITDYFLFEAIEKDNSFQSIIARLEHHGKKRTSHHYCQCRP